ncbi:MAG: response regulator transcription factor [Spirochaetia bacterium]|nr:response regulator transcription factor [Spirochaetia bacterium]
MIKVVIADDHELLRDGMSKLIEKQSDITLIGEAESAEETMQLLRTNSVDVVVLDIGLPDKDGIEVLKDIKAERIKTRVLMLSMHPENRYAQRAIKNGAAGYLTKDYAAKTIADAIRKVYHQGSYITEEVARQLYTKDFNAGDKPAHELLSDREYQIFVLIGQGKSVSEISEQLNISVSSVNTYRKRILDKTGLTANTDIIRYAYTHNLV